ncbi:tripartite tricarboxylate transporter substrate binding protein [Pseudorhodoplanes sp.]|jgi:tripartite-type tricarboxylate transporter receptor subunit TctC|uniref:Bug family tripartite tricarboxylate transporter substrate binding protein n=1 Tax=Pseudorhodoplanes sp. TaxID=1934341 RepID=UPI002B71F7BA|nr:tripartite tricarboxylate transporter substrate binding protein [Pseudorhodoplanes sp.]HWV42665.1 tripartite tricarboxylate transporter substrate binding protein [Pseudorhodoplanes sp.]
MRVAALILAAIIGVITPAKAQDWPAKTVRIVVPFGPGSTPDIVARLLAEQLQAKYPGSAFVIENKPGASGNTGTDAVAKATPDGTTIGVSIGGPLAINTILFSKLPYDPKKDIAPITQLVTMPSALAVHPDLGVKTVADLIALLKKEPGKYNFGSIGNGSLSHLTMEAIAQKSGAQLVHVPYPSSPAAMTALVRGDVHLAALPAIAVTPQSDVGKVTIIAVTLPKRSPFLSNIPTLKESGVDVEADTWMGLIAPGGTPPALIAAINKDVVEALQARAVRDKLATQYMEPVGNSPDAFRAVIDNEAARWSPIIKAGNIKIN